MTGLPNNGRIFLLSTPWLPPRALITHKIFSLKISLDPLFDVPVCFEMTNIEFYPFDRLCQPLRESHKSFPVSQ